MRSSFHAPTLAELRRAALSASTRMKALAHEDRLLLLWRLADGENHVSELESLSGIHQPSLSQHLGVLREAGLVATRRDGKHVYYRLSRGDTVRIALTLAGLHVVGASVQGQASASRRAGSTRTGVQHVRERS